MGLTLLARARGQGLLDREPVLVMSGQTYLDIRGVQGVFIKPFSWHDLLARMRELLSPPKRHQRVRPRLGIPPYLLSVFRAMPKAIRQDLLRQGLELLTAPEHEQRLIVRSANGQYAILVETGANGAEAMVTCVIDPSHSVGKILRWGCRELVVSHTCLHARGVMKNWEAFPR